VSEPMRYPDLDYQLELLLNGRLGPEDLARLEAAILKDAEVKDYCIDYFLTAASVRRSSHGTADLPGTDLAAALRRRRGRRSQRHWWARPWIQVAAAAMILLLCLPWVLTHRESKPKGPVMGKLMDQSGARWQSPYRDLRPGGDIHTGLSELREGLAEIKLPRGAEVILQAPCVFSLDGANEMTLISGKLAAAVGPAARGFTVYTESAVLTDLGTSFGLTVEPQGRVEAHVFDGRVILAPSPEGSSRASGLVLDAGQAGVVDHFGQAGQAAYGAQTRLFVRVMPKHGELSCPGERLNLADIVGSGNGFGTGVLGEGIDLLTGRTFTRPIPVVRQAAQGGFTRVADQRYIDGVFVPNAQHGKVVISSTGLVFRECPETLGTYYEGVVNSAEQTVVGEPDTTFPGRLRGVVYGTAEHPALSIHPNAGITFDLEAIRADNPGVRVERFTALCGVAEDIPRSRPYTAHVWVLVDATVGFDLHIPHDQSLSKQVDVPIAPEARFLTLVTTCPGDAGFSWIFFGDPILNLTVEE
jgi:hypothetical protein